MISFRPLFRDRSFAFKFTLLTTIPIVCVTVSIALLATNAFEKSITDATYVRVKNNTYLAALSMSNPYVVYNKTLLDSFVDSLKQENDIIYAFVVDYNDGRILAHSDHSRDGQFFVAAGAGKIQIIGSGTNGIAELPGTGYEAVSPIHISGDLFGTVRVGFSLDAVYRKIAALRMNIIGITLLAILFSLGLSVLLARLLSKPILTLASQAQEVADGNFEQEIAYESKDVVGRLSRAFNIMTEELRNRLHVIEANEEKYRALFEASNDAVLVLDEGQIVGCNQQTLKLFQGDFENILGKTLADLSPQRQPDGSLSGDVLERKTTAVLSGSGDRFYWKHKRIDQTELDAEVSLSTTLISDERMILAVVQDITERKAAETEIENLNRTLEKRVEARTRDLEKTQEAMLNLVEDLNTSKKDLEQSRKNLEIQKAYLEQLFEASTEAIALVSEKDRAVRVNREFTNLFGFAPEEVIGKSLDDTIIPRKCRAEGKRLKDDIKSGKKPFHDTQRQTKSGALLDVSVTGLSIHINGRDAGVYAIYRDISDRKQAEKKLQKAHAAAEAANRAKSEFLANMSHEIRTPMNAVTGMAHLLGQTVLTPLQQRYVSNILLASKSLLGIIDDILDFSKIEAGKLKLESIEFSFNDVLTNLSNMISMEAQEKGLEFVIDSSTNLPLNLVGDSLRLEQVLVNLTKNAVKFTEKGEVVISSELIKEEDQSAVLRFSVRDTGIGLTRKQRSRLFAAFSQADTSTTRKFGGTGLGLVISKRLVEMMGGELRVESEAGKGSTFSFTARFGIKDKERREFRLPATDWVGSRVLVVDDNRIALEVLRNYLEAFSFNVTTVDSGYAAIYELRQAETTMQNPYDLVLMDWKMPGMSGIETTRRIREEAEIPRKPYIILITAHGGELAVEATKEMEFDGYLVKPVTQSTLFDAIISALGDRTAKDPVPERREAHLPEGLDAISGARILLVEDNEINQDVAVGLLQNAGFQVTVAGNGREAVDMLEHKGAEAVRQKQGSPFDIVLMDLQMPVMDGYEAAKRIRHMNLGTRGEKNPEPQHGASIFETVPIIAMTADVVGGVRERCFTVGMNDYVSKPIDPGELFSVLVKWVKPGERDLKPGIGEKEPGGDGADMAVKGKPSRADLPGNLPGINIKDALKRVGGDSNLLSKLLKKFSVNHGDAVAEIESAIDSGNRDRAIRLAHTLKGLSGTIGARQLHETAKVLEASIRAEETETGRFLDGLSKELSRVITGITAWDENDRRDDAEPASAVSEMDMARVQLLLDEIEVLLEDDDTDAGRKLAELKAIPGASAAANEWAIMEQRLGEYDFDKALEELEKIKDRLGIE